MEPSLDKLGEDLSKQFSGRVSPTPLTPLGYEEDADCLGYFPLCLFCLVTNTSREHTIAAVEGEPAQGQGSPVAGAKGKGKAKGAAASPTPINSSIWEMDQKPNLFRNYGMLELYSSEVGLKNIPGLMWHRLSVLGESASQSHEGFGAWSWAHVVCGAHLPLRSYFANFCVKAGIAPFQLIPPSYKLLAGWYIFCKSRDLEPPTPEEVLYFYGLKSQPMRGHADKIGFYRLERYPDVMCPSCHTARVPDLREYWFLTTGFPLKRVPALSLDFKVPGKRSFFLDFAFLCLAYLPGGSLTLGFKLCSYHPPDTSRRRDSEEVKNL